MGVRRIWVGLVVGLVAATPVVGACSSGGDKLSDDDRATLESVRSVFGPEDLLTALESERSVTSLTALGLASAVPDVPDLAEARAATDERLSDLGYKDTAEVFPATRNTAATLKQLRKDLDTVLPKAGFEQLPHAGSLFDRYTALLAQYFDRAEQATVGALDDPSQREGVRLLFTVGRLRDQEDQLVFRLMTGELDPKSAGSEEITELSRLVTLQAAEVQDLQAAKHERYRRVVAASFPDERYQAVRAAAEEALAGKPVDVTQLLAAVTSAGGDPYEVLQDKLSEAFIADVDG